MQYLDVGVGYAEPCRRVLQRQPLAVPQDDQGAQTFVQPVQGFTERLKGFPLQQTVVYAGCVRQIVRQLRAGTMGAEIVDDRISGDGVEPCG